MGCKLAIELLFHVRLEVRVLLKQKFKAPCGVDLQDVVEVSGAEGCSVRSN
jgi:hypothetical protein